jgi:hypothetical protein
VFREHYKQLGSPTGVRRGLTQFFARVSSSGGIGCASESTKRNAKYDTFLELRWNAASRGPAGVKLATLLIEGELIKAGRSALVKLLLKLVNWVWELETLPQRRGRKGVIVNLFKTGDLPEITGGGSTLVSICRKMFYEHVAQAWSLRCDCTARAAFRN